VSGKHRPSKQPDLPKREPGKAGDAELDAAVESASKGGGRVVKVNVKRSEKH
jgi:hypothetical protein